MEAAKTFHVIARVITKTADARASVVNIPTGDMRFQVEPTRPEVAASDERSITPARCRDRSQSLELGGTVSFQLLVSRGTSW